MATYATPLSGGKTSAQGFQRILGRLFTSSGVLEDSLEVSAQLSPDMTVLVSGSSLDDNAVFINTDGHFIGAWNTSNATVTISANASGSGKVDAIVAYVDLDDYDAANANNPGSLKFKAVRGASGAPNSGEITADSDVDDNPYIILAHVAVANGASSINSGNITDQRVFAGLDGALLGEGSVTFDRTTGVWWEELGRTTLSVAGDTISVSGLPNRKHLRIMVRALNSGTIDTGLRLNGDSGTNYAWRISSNGGADTTGTSSQFIAGGTASTTAHTLVYDVVNVANQPKDIQGYHLSNGGSAYTAPTRREITAVWHNTSNPISQVDAYNNQSGSFATGSELIVLGHN